MTGSFDVLKVEIYGESHSAQIGVKLFGLPSGFAVDEDFIKKTLLRRSSKSNAISTPRKEKDDFEIVAGVKDGMTTGGVFEAEIKNEDVHPEDYDNVKTVPRPSHADYAAYLRDGKIPTGGGRFSGRMTAPLCVAGALAECILKTVGIKFHSYVSEIGGVKIKSENSFDTIENDILTSDTAINAKITDILSEALKDGDSVGGAVECVCAGAPAGMLGDNMFEGLESKISYAVYGVPGVKGVEFGAGFGFAGMRGSKANDAFCFKDGQVETVTNKSGGINGGISNGMPIVLRAAVRPTPSIGRVQRSVDLAAKTEVDLEIKGRHDACIVPRAVPCVESAVALAMLDEALKRGLIGRCAANGLDCVRKEIDGIDDDVASLLKKRLDCVRRVAGIKRDGGVAVADKHREDGIAERLTSGAKADEKEFIQRVYKTVFETSRDLQSRIIGGEDGGAE